ncbi:MULTISPECIES: polysaccharide deacetylase family protein [Chryseobacterium]|uniref:polysaccharide deacetylase family protein n=1 Tax=Chryseobacterium TaxID=59732 RepID=UPI00195D95E6|nr:MULTISPECIES: polysaccharide deacetylase family protein [Chryseobacterium]MBM7418570.1 peptidoglycan/xylan/chitin deacetylase (PgdA/CDA1 family) [Chryseobacterium sp. JUb44]MDH6208479.1 peptidoglycan/xylan/chitin deacetylase (PgdA/CDA1 family) [Chryseobacterium sp. BIGb0186]WSO11371.1 polysaccharide deacetylase family protein [Chryseobacterium scophthalmum]
MVQFFKRVLGLSKKESIRILMYHLVLPQSIAYKNDLIVTVENLEEQLIYIKNNFKTVFFKDLETSKSVENKIILTFDDGYYNNLQYLIPLLEKHQLKATIFIPTEFIQNNLNGNEKVYMNFDEIKSLNPDLVEIALHSHSHKNFSQMTVSEAEADLLKNIEILDQNEINFTKVLAYPYGKFPKEKEFFKMLDKIGIESAMRIGNNVASYPFKKRFEVNRIDIKYGDSLKAFKWKLKFGKTKL